MRLFRIKTLGSEFLFASDPSGVFASVPKEALRFSFSDSADFELDYDPSLPYFIPDVERAAAAYIKHALGYPASEYDIRMPWGKRTVYVHRGSSLKTTIISAPEQPLPYALPEKEIFTVSVCRTPYALIPCENAEFTDTEYILNAARRCGMVMPRALVAFSKLREGYAIRASRICGESTPDSRCYAALALWLFSEGYPTREGISINDGQNDVLIKYEPPTVTIVSRDGSAERIYRA